MRCKNDVECSYGDIVNTFHFLEPISPTPTGFGRLKRWRMQQIRENAHISLVTICEDHHNELLLLTLFYGTAWRIPYEIFACGDIQEVRDWRERVGKSA